MPRGRNGTGENVKYFYWVMMYICWQLEDAFDHFVPIEKQTKQFYPSAIWEDLYRESR